MSDSYNVFFLLMSPNDEAAANYLSRTVPFLVTLPNIKALNCFCAFFGRSCVHLLTWRNAERLWHQLLLLSALPHSEYNEGIINVISKKLLSLTRINEKKTEKIPLRTQEPHLACALALGIFLMK